MKFKFYNQLEMVDCGPCCLKMVLMHYGKDYPLAELREICSVTRVGVSLQDIARGAKNVGFNTMSAKLTIEELFDVPLPCILHWNQDHFVVLHEITEGRNNSIFFHLADPGFGKMKLTVDEFRKEWSPNSNKGIALLLEQSESFNQIHPSFKNTNDLLESWLFLKGHLRGNKGKLYTIAFLLTLSVMASWFYPVLLSRLIDKGVNQKNLNIVWFTLFAQLSLFSGQLIFESIRSIMSSYLSNKISKEIITGFIKKLIKLPINFFDTKLHTDILQRIEDHTQIEGFLTYMVIQFVFSLLTFIVMSGLLISYKVIVFGIFIILSAISVGWTLLFFQKRKIIDYKRFRIKSDYRNILFETINGMSEIKINNAQDAKMSLISTLQDSFYDLNITSTKISQYQSLGSNSINQFKNIIITFLCAFWVIDGSLTFGEMMSISYIVGLLNSPIENFISFFRSGQDAKISFTRLNEIQKKNEENDSSKITSFKEFKNGIFLNNVSFKYEKNALNFTLSDINLVIPKSKVTAIVGMSGSGKSTLIKLLLNFYNPQIGEISIDNLNMKDMNSDSWRDRCGVVMQDGFIYSNTIAENIAIAEETLDHERLIYAAKAACIYEFINTLPLEFSTKIGNSGIQLSGGQKQRILIARAIYKNPEFIFLDEATNALDSSNENSIINNLNHFFEGRTVVIIAHRLSTVRNADKIVVLNAGKIVEEGTHESLINSRGEYYNLVIDQLEIASEV